MSNVFFINRVESVNVVERPWLYLVIAIIGQAARDARRQNIRNKTDIKMKEDAIAFFKSPVYHEYLDFISCHLPDMEGLAALRMIPEGCE